MDDHGVRAVAAALARGGARACYRTLLLAYPREFRRRDGAAAVGLFESVCRDAWAEGGPRAVLRRLGHALVEVPRRGLAERWSRQSGQGHAGRRTGGSCIPEAAPRRGAGPHAGQGPGGARGSDRPPPGPWGGRGPGLLSGLVLDLRHSLRGLARRPGFTAAVVTALAIGIGANTAIFSVVDDTLLRPLPFRDADRVVLVRARAVEDDARRDPTVEQLLRWEAAAGVFERLEARSARVPGRSAGRGVLLREEDGPPRWIGMLRVTPGFLESQGIRPLAGRLLTAADARSDAVPVVVVTEEFWRRRLGADPDVVGETITLDGVSHTVVGVAPEVMADEPASSRDLYAPLPVDGSAAASTPAWGVAWLRPGISLEAARQRLEAVSATVDAGGERIVGTLERPFNIFWQSDSTRVTLLTLMGTVFLVLAIACVNVANLLLAAGAVRRGELAVRSALGAGRLQIARLLLTESLLLTLAGGALGLLVAWVALGVVTSLDPGTVQLRNRLATVRLDGLVLAYATVIATLTGLAAGLVPALRGSAPHHRETLQQADPRSGGARRGLGHAFVVVQMALSVMLLILAGLVTRAFLEMTFTEPGFEPDRVLTVRVELPETLYPDGAQRRAFFGSLTAELARLPGVTGVSLGYASVPPGSFGVRGPFEIEDRGAEGSAELSVTGSRVDAHYFDVMGIPLLAGRSFLPEELGDADPAADRPVVVSRSWADRFFPDGGAIGARFRTGGSADGPRNRVVGIAGDVSTLSLGAPAARSARWKRHVYFPLDPARARGFTNVLLRLADGASPPVAALLATIQRIDPRLPAGSPETAATAIHDWLAWPRFKAALFAIFAIVALVLAALGVFGVVSHAVRRRTREMGIRLALGAGPRRVLRLVLRQGMAPVLVGILVGAAAARIVLRAMTGLLYQVGAGDPLTYVATGALLGTVALVAVWIPARRATWADPVQALRSE